MQEIQVLGMYRDIVEEARDLISVHSMNMEVGRSGVRTQIILSYMGNHATCDTHNNARFCFFLLVLLHVSVSAAVSSDSKTTHMTGWWSNALLSVCDRLSFFMETWHTTVYWVCLPKDY